MDRELDSLIKMKQKFLIKGNFQEAAKVCHDISCVYSSKDQFLDAVSELEDAVEFCGKGSTQSKQMAAILRSLGENLLETGEHERAINTHLKFLKITEEMADDLEIQRAWATLGRTYYEVCSRQDTESDDVSKEELIDKAKEAYLTSSTYISKLTDIIPTKDVKEMETGLLINLGLVYEKKGDFNNCSRCMMKALCLSKNHGLIDDLHRCQFSLAVMYQSLGKFPEALRLLDEAVESAEQLGSKKLSSDCYFIKTMIYLETEEIAKAKESIRLSYKSCTRAKRNQVKKLYQVVVVIKDCKDKLDAEELETNEHMSLLEKLGDTWAYIRNFKKAIIEYKKLLNVALEAGLPSKRLAPIYYSIAQSYEDNSQLEEALEFYLNEIKCNKGNKKEQILTMLKVAAAQEQLDEDAEETLKEAVRLARGLSIKGRCLIRLKQYQINNDLDEVKETEKMLAEIGYEGPEESEDEPESVDPYEDIDVSSEEETMTANTRAAGRRNCGGKQTNWTKKRNEKGETPLHVACIAGNIKQVTKLLEEGHPVNIRDNSGWLPLHEACNYGHTEIVNVLLQNGAWLNDPGGQFCDGVTPLHDAASGGHFEVIKLLLKNNASVTKLTKDSSTPLDCLLEWRTRVSELSENDEMDFEEVETLLKERLDKCSFTALPVTNRKRKASPESETVKVRSLINEEEAHLTLDDEEMAFAIDEISDSEIPPLMEEPDNDFDDPNVARMEYRKAMENIRKKKNGMSLNAHKPPKDIPALVGGDYVVDDWLINDVDAAKKPSKKKMRQTRLDVPIVKRNIRYNHERSTPEIRTPSPELFDEDSLQPSPEPLKNCSTSNRVQCVRVRDKAILVPVLDPESTFQWLAEEAAKRYFDATCIKVVISVCRKDGAIFAPSDKICDLVCDGEKELMTEVQSCVFPSLPEKYTSVCNGDHKFSFNEEMLKLLSISEESGVLEFQDMRQMAPIWNPALKAAQHQMNLRQISITGFRLSVEPTLTLICELLSTLPNLLHLKLEACGLSASFLTRIVETSSGQASFPKELKTLNLNYNDFRHNEKMVLKLVELFPQLETVSLKFCDLEIEQILAKASPISKKFIV